ncbi:unnamed protein product, partial [Mycena citricolor]
MTSVTPCAYCVGNSQSCRSFSLLSKAPGVVQIHDITCFDNPWSCLGTRPAPSAPIYFAVQASVLSVCWNFSKRPASTRACRPLRYRLALAVTFSPTLLISVRAFVDWFWPVTFAFRKLIRCLFACRRARTSVSEFSHCATRSFVSMSHNLATQPRAGPNDEGISLGIHSLMCSGR